MVDASARSSRSSPSRRSGAGRENQRPASSPPAPQGEAHEERFYTVTELAAALGLTPRALRFYETKGLISPQRAGNTRVYTHRDRARMIIVLRGKKLGFSLREIKEYLDLYDMDRTQITQLRVLKAVAARRIAALEDQKRALEETLAELREIERQASEALAQKLGGKAA
jgi:DNA-binding transcriptional MerR regulator